MSNLMCCLLSGCSMRQIISLVLDLMAPIALEILFISILFGWIVKMLERRRWEPATRILYARVIRLQDSLLLDLIPDSQRRVGVHTVRCGDIAVDTLFEWSEPSPDLEMVHRQLGDYVTRCRNLLVERLPIQRNDLNHVIQAHASHMGPELFRLLLDVDTSAARLQRISSLWTRAENDADELTDETFRLIQNTLRLREWLFERDEVVVQD